MAWLRCVLLVALGLLVSACSGGQNPSGAPLDGGSLGGQAGATGSGGSAPRTEFALDVDLTYTQEGAPAPTGWWVVIVDLAGGEPQILTRVTDESAQTELVQSFPNVLQLGHEYAVAISTGGVLDCPENPETSWYEVLPPVASNVTLERSYAFGEGYDARACDVLWQSPGLAAGDYTATGPLFDNGNGIEIVVTETGRLYVRDFYVACPNMALTCGSVVGPAVCQPTGPLPGEQSWLMTSSGDYAHFEGTASVDAATQTISFSGVSQVWNTLLQPCCELNVDATLKWTGPIPYSYQTCP